MTMAVVGTGVALASGVGSVSRAAPPEPLTDSFSTDVELDAPGSGTLAAFDPSLGTLTRVDYTVDTDVLIQVCIENLSTDSGTTTGGPAAGQITVEYPGGVLTTSSIDTTVPATNLPASNGSDACLAGFDDASRTFPSDVSSSDTAFMSQTDPQSASGTITDAAGLAAFIGPGTIPFSWTTSSNADIAQPSEWDIWFVAQGSLAVSVTYTYTGASATTTTTLPCVPPGGTLPPGVTMPPGVTTPTCEDPPPCLPPGGTLPSSVTVAPGATMPTCTTTTVGTLPTTGGSSNAWFMIAVVFVAAGAAALALAGIRFRHHR